MVAHEVIAREKFIFQNLIHQYFSYLCHNFVHKILVDKHIDMLTNLYPHQSIRLNNHHHFDMENWRKNHLKYLVSVDIGRSKLNLRKLQVGPVKPFVHKHSAIVEAVCLQVPPFKQSFVEQTEAK